MLAVPSLHPPSPLLYSGWLSQLEISAAFLVIYNAYQPSLLGAYWISDKNTAELDKQSFSSTMIPNDESKPIFPRGTWGWWGNTEMSSPVVTWLSAVWGQNVLCEPHGPKNTKRDTSQHGPYAELNWPFTKSCYSRSSLQLFSRSWFFACSITDQRNSMDTWVEEEPDNN